MKFTTAIVALICTISTTGATLLDDGGAYKLTFFYGETPPFTCAGSFQRLVDSIYQEYIHEMVFTRFNVTYNAVERVDPRWSRVAGFYEAKSKFPDAYRVGRNPYAPPDEFSLDGKYNFVTTYVDPTQDVDIRVPDESNRDNYIPDVNPSFTAPSDIMSDGGPDLHRRQLRGDGGSSSRQLQKDCGLQIAVGRVYAGDCSLTLANTTGSKNQIDTLSPGAGTAQQFYENVDAHLGGHECVDILNKMRYVVTAQQI